jgi:Tol biopolymer transport system component
MTPADTEALPMPEGPANMRLSPIKRVPALASTILTLLLLSTTMPGTIAGAATPVAAVGTQADSYSSAMGISADGRRALFMSAADNLVPGASGWHPYVRDLRTGTTTLVDATVTGGVPQQGAAGAAQISSGGRYVAFQSSAPDLVAGDTDTDSQAFLRDLDTRTTEMVSVASDGTRGNGWAASIGVSEDGRYVAFQSTATNLVPGATADVRGVYLRDRQAGTTTVLFTVPFTVTPPGWLPVLSPDGRFLTYTLLAPDPTGSRSVWTAFRYDIALGTAQRVGLASDGTPASGDTYADALSRGGRYAAFESSAPNLVAGDTAVGSDVFVRDLRTNTTRLASPAVDGTPSNSASGASMSGTGRYVVFSSGGKNLVSNDLNGFWDVFVRDLQAGTTQLVSVAQDASQGNGDSDLATVSADGRYVVFDSTASNLVPGDTNGTRDVFVRDLRRGITTRVSVG